MNGKRTNSLLLVLLLATTGAFAQEVPVEPAAETAVTVEEIAAVVSEVEIVLEQESLTREELLLQEVQQLLAKAKAENAKRASMRNAGLSDAECLATAMYHEARGEGEIGMKAVAFVIHNRTKDGRWPADVCSVILQRRQFSFTEDRIPDNIKQWNVYERAMHMAVTLIKGGFDNETSPVGKAVLFHTLAVRPRWAYAKTTKFIRTLGNHRFLK